MSAKDMIQSDIVEYGGDRSSKCLGCRKFCHKVFPTGFKSEAKQLLSLAWPAIITSFFQFTLQTVSIIMSGHLAKAELDAAGLANSMINVFGISIGMGMSTACDTLFSQTFGSTNKKRVGIYLQRSLIILNSAAVLVCCLHINIMPIMNAIGQNPEISKLAADYMLCFLPGVFFDYNFLVMSRYLQDQNIVYPSMFCALIGNVVNIISQYLCIYVFHYGYLASAVCQACSLFVMMICQLIYIRVSKVYEPTWGGCNMKQALNDWGMFFRLAIPGIFMIGLEEWSFEIGTFVAGSINTVELGIQTILFQLEAISYMLPLGISIAVNIRVGQNLGANQAEHAKTSYRVGLAIMLIIGTTMGILIVSLRNYVPYLFSNDKIIIHGASIVLTLNAGFQICDGIAAVSVGALRGCGRQIVGAVIFFIGYWVISVPIGITLALVAHMNVFGIWTGLLIGIGLLAITFLILINLTNWQNECERAAIVAYGGGDEGPEQPQTSYQSGEKISLSGPSDIERDPLIRKRSEQRLRRKSSVTARRAAISPREIDIPESKVETPENYRWLFIKRGIYAAVIVAIAIAAIIIRSLQMTPCYPVNNSTMFDYQGVLPLCNETNGHSVPSGIL